MRSANTTRYGRKAAITVVAMLATVVSLLGTGAPAEAGASPSPVYASTTYNRMWHRGTVNFYNGNRNIDTSITFNDVGGDPYCTQLRMKVHFTNGTSSGIDQWNQISVCGGRTGTYTTTFFAPSGYRFTQVDIWTVRADGGIRSYLWSFTP